MSKRAANNVTRDIKSSSVKTAELDKKADAAHEEMKADDALFQEKEALKSDAVELKAEAINADADAAEALNSDDADAISVKAAEELKQEADAAFDAADDATKTADDAATQKKSVAEQLAEIKAAREKLAAEKEALRMKRQQEAEALKEQKELERALAELEADKAILEVEKSKTAEDLLKEEEERASQHDDWEAAFAEGNFKVSAENQDKFFIHALIMCGNSVDRIGILRDYWKQNSKNFRDINANETTKGEKQQKAIMRRTLNRLLESKRVLKDGTKLSINSEWKAEEKK